MSFRLSPAAIADIESAALFIAEDNPTAAKAWVADIRRQCNALGEMPGMGVARSDVQPGLRMFVAGNYLILYRQQGDDVDIVRVLHSARQWQELL